MAGESFFNFDGLIPEASESIAMEMVETTRIKIKTISEQIVELLAEKSATLGRSLGSLKVADGNCRNGCAG